MGGLIHFFAFLFAFYFWFIVITKVLTYWIPHFFMSKEVADKYFGNFWAQVLYAIIATVVYNNTTY